MDCLVLPVTTIFGRGCSGHRLRYKQLTDDDFFVGLEDRITVVVGKERKKFLVDPFVLDEYPFRVLIDLVSNKNKHSSSRMNNRVDLVKKRREVYVDVDAILFEHMLWLMHNDSSSLFNLNLKEIIDFYAQDY